MHRDPRPPPANHGASIPICCIRSRVSISSQLCNRPVCQCSVIHHLLPVSLGWSLPRLQLRLAVSSVKQECLRPGLP
ncbi:hypothetical protein GQ607_009326 [Colletotrichum asianum]|uniref:Uncharacterized protein n=1 Tax=Colletotrichum asianum TaxID=702518 RepID=A0A8H3WAZ6_9PEZI|nr:hypothetical protein GQ607_009326 [Colletotrichum asianum]